ncbi:phycobilisome protein [Synechocystis sp. PCC 7509]|uniref:phycobilisome protein n=1 Tax=Synechocystis sp. PCC 7509 TaxID=927677 RepID=UPI0002ABCD08|nr:phycobilisome protein [Synechocystis sp. PCC 7509]
MNANIQSLLYDADERYLKSGEIGALKSYTSSLSQRLETYELLRDQETTIFQPIANQLLASFPDQQHDLERSLKNWLAVLRYCTMAMLLNNSEFLERRLLEWLTDIVRVHRTQAIDTALYEGLEKQIPQILADNQYSLLQPFLAQAAASLLVTDNLAQLSK